MSVRIPTLSMLALALAAPAGVHAHHSIARVYDSESTVQVTGVVTEFRFVNPHPILVVEVNDDAGVAQAWLLEMDNRSELAQIGMTAETFVPGDRVVGVGSLARTQTQRLYLRRLERPADGLWYEQVGYRPRLGGGAQ